MEKVRLCHSIWTKPMKGLRWDIADQLKQNIWLFALSVAYAKKMNAEIVLHTDELGKEIFGFLPYDEIHLTLEGLNVHERFWAAGKIFAQEAEPLGSVHIDGDVFLKKPEVYKLIKDNSADLIVQMVEGDSTPSCLGSCYEENLNLVLSALNRNVPVEFDRNQDSAFNCGLVRFNNPELKRRYIEGYKEMLEFCSREQSFIKRLIANTYQCPDIIMEQWWLKSVADYYDYKVKTVLPGWGGDNHGEAKKIGFTHVIGKDKYAQIPIVKNSLLMINPDLYCMVVKQIMTAKL